MSYIMKKKILLYLVLIIPSYLLFAGIWSFLVSPNFFVCTDPIPFLDFHPPFVHGSQYGDYFILSPLSTYLAWSLHLGPVVLIPYISTVKLTHK